jgi:hypothetical protein
VGRERAGIPVIPSLTGQHMRCNRLRCRELGSYDGFLKVPVIFTRQRPITTWLSAIPFMRAATGVSRSPRAAKDWAGLQLKVQRRLPVFFSNYLRFGLKDGPRRLRK